MLDGRASRGGPSFSRRTTALDKAMSKPFPIVLSLCLTGGMFMPGAFAKADTSFNRQFAKDDPQTYFIVSGPEAARLARAEVAEILANKEYKWDAKKGDKIHVLTLEEAEKEAAATHFGPHTRIFLIARNELTGALPENLQSALPVDLAAMPPRSGLLRTKCLNASAGKLCFAMAFVAPDGERLGRMLQGGVRPPLRRLSRHDSAAGNAVYHAQSGGFQQRRRPRRRAKLGTTSGPPPPGWRPRHAVARGMGRHRLASSF